MAAQIEQCVASLAEHDYSINCHTLESARARLGYNYFCIFDLLTFYFVFSTISTLCRGLRAFKTSREAFLVFFH
jgi:hypothetical protein